MIALIIICIFFWLCFFSIIPYSIFTTISVFVVIVWVAIAAFFRDPERKIPEESGILVSPADGVVRDIELIPGEAIDNDEMRELFQNRDVLRIGIFLSVFNVHLNRAPAAMNVVFRSYKEGAFHDARDGRAIRENE